MVDAGLQQRFAKTRVLLKATVHSCARLLDALQDERAAIEANDVSALNVAVSRKKIQMAELEQHEQRRKALLASCRHKDDLAAMQVFVTNNDNPAKELQSLWAKTLTLLADCRDANRANGKIIATQQRMHSEALNILRDREDVPEVYGPGGKTETTGQYRALAEV